MHVITATGMAKMAHIFLSSDHISIKLALWGPTCSTHYGLKSTSTIIHVMFAIIKQNFHGMSNKNPKVNYDVKILNGNLFVCVQTNVPKMINITLGKLPNPRNLHVP